MKRKWFPLWVLPVGVVFAVGTVWLRLHVVRTSYEIDQANQSIQNIKKENESLELKATRLRSPTRLKKLAKDHFDLSPAQVNQTVFVEKGRVPSSEKK